MVRGDRRHATPTCFVAGGAVAGKAVRHVFLAANGACDLKWGGGGAVEPGAVRMLDFRVQGSRGGSAWREGDPACGMEFAYRGKRDLSQRKASASSTGVPVSSFDRGEKYGVGDPMSVSIMAAMRRLRRGHL